MRYGKEGQGRTGETVGVKIKVCEELDENVAKSHFLPTSDQS